MIRGNSSIVSSFKFSVGMNLALIICTCFGSQFCQAQSDPTKDTLAGLYEYDLRYVGNSTSMSPKYIYILDELIELLNKNPRVNIHVRGHVCCGPNKRISRKRGRKIYRFLKASGIADERLSYGGYSNEIPLAFPEETEEDEIKNRRVDFILSYKK
jgi:outer membrane protein OmpA-like peptidoglycan-associated protein